MQWNGEGETRNSGYTMYYSGGESVKRGAAKVVHKSKVRGVIKKSVCHNRNIALKLQAKPVS
jgi:hypothetical protein